LDGKHRLRHGGVALLFLRRSLIEELFLGGDGCRKLRDGVARGEPRTYTNDNMAVPFFAVLALFALD
jgi:hypothetical protein